VIHSHPCRSLKSPRFAGLRFLLLFLAAALSQHQVASAQTVTVAASISLAEYQSKLDSLTQLVATCQHAMTPANCQSSQVGPDLTVALPSGTRQIRFAWLRDLLDRAAKPQTTQTPSAKAATAKSPNPSPEFTPPSLATQLEDARLRLAADKDFAAKAPGHSVPDYHAQRQALTGILADKQYHAAVARPTMLRRLLERVGNWLDTAIAKLQRAGFRSRWVGLTAEIIFGVLISVALVWFLIRLERQGRLNSTFLGPGMNSGAASARDWQLWLEDARNAAALGAWRDAIHFLYWASISRLESSGLWPADRARTPREYLSLLPQTSAQRPGLTTLTRSFERTWYAGRPAQESDFREAEQMAAQLGISSGARTPTQQGAR